jgi:hypothetical protein
MLSFAKEGKILTCCDCMKYRLSAVFEELFLDEKKIRLQIVFVSAGSCARPIQELGTNLSEQHKFQTESFECLRWRWMNTMTSLIMYRL